MSDVTMYSSEIAGEYGNHKKTIRFDKTGRRGGKTGYIGISQYEANGNGPTDRVLLSQKQVKALVVFLGKPIETIGA